MKSLFSFAPAAADRLVQKIFRATDLLARNPAISRTGRVPGTRELIIPGTPYILPYRVRANALEILRVFHAARQWPQIPLKNNLNGPAAAAELKPTEINSERLHRPDPNLAIRPS